MYIKSIYICCYGNQYIELYIVNFAEGLSTILQMHGRVMERGDQVSCQENTKGLHGATSSAAVFKVGLKIITTSQLQLFSFREKPVMRHRVLKLGLSAILIYSRHGD